MWKNRKREEIGKANKYSSGRADKMLFVWEIATRDDFEEPGKGIQFRSITGMSTVMCKKEVNQVCEGESNFTGESSESSFLHIALRASMLASISPRVIRSAESTASSSSDRHSESLHAIVERK